MEAAQAAVARHTSRRGHFTKVSEVVRPVVTLETIKPHRHEITTEAVDREVHQHHYHTTVQPLTHVETLPTKHHHNLVAGKKTSHEHDDVEENKRRLAEFAGLFRDLSVTLPTTHSSEKKAAVVGEHVHHHVHEVVQPIIYKETIQRETVHTTLPHRHIVREAPKFHGLSAMPVKMMDEFLSFNSGREPGAVRHSEHEGAPRDYDAKFATTFEKLGLLAAPAATSSTTAPLAVDTATANTHNTHHVPTTPTRKPVRSNRNSADRAFASPTSRGSISSNSSASSSAPPTPTSPEYRNNMLPKNNVMNTMSLNSGVTSPTQTTSTTTTTPTTKVNTMTNSSTTTKVNRIPSKNAGANEPVRIRNSNDGDLSPRYSSEETGHKRGFLNRLSGRRAAY